MLESILSAIPPPVAFAILLVLLCLPYVLITSAIERAKGLPVPKDVQEAGTTKEWRKLNKHHELTSARGSSPQRCPTPCARATRSTPSS